MRTWLKALWRRNPKNASQYDCNLSAVIDWLESAGHVKAAADLRHLQIELKRLMNQ